MGTSGTASKSRELIVMRPKIKAGISLTDWEAFKLSFNLFKATTDVQPDKIVFHLLSCLDRDLLKLLYWENNEPEKLTEENLLKAIKFITVKREDIWYTRENLHQLTQDREE